MKKILAALLCLLLAASAFTGCNPQIMDGDGMVYYGTQGNMLKLTDSDFYDGTLEGVKIEEAGWVKALVLEDGATEGTFTSHEYGAPDFVRMVACWNAAIYEGGAVEIWARAQVDGEWTDWLSWGRFTPYETRGSRKNKKCDGAYIDEDTFIVSGGYASALQMKAVLTRAAADDPSPALREMTMTLSGGDAKPTYIESGALDELPDKALCTAPAICQEIRYGSIADSICSPTTMTVMLDSRGEALLPEEVALVCLDHGEDIFGSWSFTCAAGGLYGYECYCQYADENILMQELAKGRVCGLSVKYAPKRGKGLPVLDGTCGSTNGHLIAIIGYEYEDGIRDDEHLYFYSSDSYADGDEYCYRRYSWQQLSLCWESRMAYIMPTDGIVTPPCLRSEQVKVEFLPNNEYRLQHEDGTPFSDDELYTFIRGDGILAYAAPVDNEDLKNGGLASDHSIVYEQPMTTAANWKFSYTHMMSDGRFKIDVPALREYWNVPADRSILLYAIGEDGHVYITML